MFVINLIVMFREDTNLRDFGTGRTLALVKLQGKQSAEVLRFVEVG